MGPWGPLREEGVSPLGLAPRVGPTTPLGRRTPPPWEFSPTWGRGGGWHPLLAYIRRGRPPFFQHTNISFFLLLLPGSGLPLFGVCTWIGVLHHKAGRRSVGVGIRSRLSSAARLVRGTTPVVLLRRWRFTGSHPRRWWSSTRQGGRSSESTPATFARTFPSFGLQRYEHRFPPLLYITIAYILGSGTVGMKNLCFLPRIPTVLPLEDHQNDN